MVMRGRSGGSVHLTVSDGPDEWQINRSVTSKGAQTLTVVHTRGGENVPHAMESLKERQDYVNSEVVGCSYGLFVNSVMTPQDHSESFVKATASRRKELLLEMAGADMIDSWSDMAKERLATERQRLASLQSEALTLRSLDRSSEIAELSARIPPVEEVKSMGDRMAELNGTVIPKAQELCDSAMATLADYRAKAASQFRDTDRAMKIRGELLDLDKVPAASEAAKSLEAAVKDLDETMGIVERNRLQHEKIQLVESLKRGLMDVRGPEALISQLTDRMKAIRGEKASDCPVTGKECPIASDARESRAKEVETALDRERANLEDRMERNRATEEEIGKETEALASLAITAEEISRTFRIKGMREEVAMRERMLKASEGAESERARLNEELARISQAGPSYSSLIPDAEIALANRAAERLKAVEESNSLSSKLSRISADSESLERIRKASADHADRLKAVEAQARESETDVEDITMVKDAFGTNGVKAMVVDMLVPEIEHRTNEILGRLSGFRVSMSTLKDSSDGKKKVEGLFVTVHNTEGAELDFDGYSGGERMKISVAITEALATFQRCGFRLFDETFIGLDDESVERFSEILTGLDRRFPQVICVSHVQAVKSLFDHRLTVSKSNGISSVIQ